MTMFLQNRQEEETVVVREREFTSQMGDITAGIEVKGKLHWKTVPYHLNEGTTLKSINVKVGNIVKKGDVLAISDVSPEEKEIDQLQLKRMDTEASLNKAKQEYDVFLVDCVEDSPQGEILRKAITIAEENLKYIDKQIDKNKKLMDKQVLYADRSGVIIEVNYAVGDKVGFKPIVMIGDPKKKYLELQVDSENIVNIKKGQVVEFYVEAYPSESFGGKVEGKQYAPNSDGKYVVTATVNQTKKELIEGMDVGATLIIKQKKDVLTLSNKAFTLIEGKQYVKVRNPDGTLKEIEIKTGFSDGRKSEILSGLKKGDVVIVEM